MEGNSGRSKRHEQALKYERVAKKVSLNETDLAERDRRYFYPSSNFLPCAFFFKYLARKPTSSKPSKENPNALKLNLADSIVVSDGDLPPFWLYTSAAGYVTRLDVFSSFQIAQRFQGEFPVVIKKPSFRSGVMLGNDIEAVSSEDIEQKIMTIFKEKSSLVVIQKYIPPKLNRPFICRTVWRDNGTSLAWVISRKKEKEEGECAILKIAEMHSCSIIESTSGQFLDETLVYVADIARYFHTQISINFKEIVADFVRDAAGKWWMINVKGFIVDQIPSSMSLKSITHYGDIGVDINISPFAGIANRVGQYCRMKKCKFCEEKFPSHTLTKHLNLKQIIQADRHLQHRGYRYSWLSRMDLKHIDAPMLYHTHPVCEDCFQLYAEISKLIKIEVKMANQQGIQIDEESSFSQASSTQLKGFYKAFNVVDKSSVNKFQNNPNAAEMPLNWSFNIDTETELVLNNNNPSKQGQQSMSVRYRFMILLNEIKDIPYDRESIDMQYSVRFQFLDVSEKYPIEISRAVQNSRNHDEFSVQMNCLRVIFLFSNSRSELNNFISEQGSFKIDLICGNQVIGTASFELADFKNPNVTRKDYQKVFTGSKLPLMKWAANVTLGLAESGQVETQRIPLRSFAPGIMIPDKDYYTCEPLHPDWMQNINSLPSYQEESEMVVSRRERSISKAKDFKKAMEANLDCSEILQKSYYSVNISSQFVFPNDPSVVGNSQRTFDISSLLRSKHNLMSPDKSSLRKSGTIYEGNQSIDRKAKYQSEQKKDLNKTARSASSDLSFSMLLTSAEHSAQKLMSQSMLGATSSFREPNSSNKTAQRPHSASIKPKAQQIKSFSTPRKSLESAHSLRSSRKVSVVETKKALEGLLQLEISAYV